MARIAIPLRITLLYYYSGPDVQCQTSSGLTVGGVGGVATELEDQELYMMCLCEQPSLGGGLRMKKGKETFIGFLVGDLNYAITFIHA